MREGEGGGGGVAGAGDGGGGGGGIVDAVVGGTATSDGAGCEGGLGTIGNDGAPSSTPKTAKRTTASAGSAPDGGDVSSSSISSPSPDGVGGENSIMTTDASSGGGTMTRRLSVRTYGDMPFSEASTSLPPGTCPSSGRFEGHFRNVIANVHGGGGGDRVREMFYLFFNSSPPSDAKVAFAENDSTIIANEMLDGKADADVVVDGGGDGAGDDGGDKLRRDFLLPESHVHVRGYGANAFGAFEIVGSLDPVSGALKCQRMYVPAPTPADISSAVSSVVGGPALVLDLSVPGVNEGGGGGGRRGRPSLGRKRASSWKKRDMSDEAMPRPSTNEGGVGSKPPQCRGGGGFDVGPSDIRAPPVGGISTAKPSPRAVSTTGTAASTVSRKEKRKRSKGGTTSTVGGGVGGRPRCASSAQVPVPPGASSVAPFPSVVPTLPTAGDPFLARWRAAHYLYYQRVEQEPDDGQGSTATAGVGNPSLGGGAVTAGTSRPGVVKFNYVVYEGEMNDGMRDGCGVCLYNNNTLYEGQWKKNREHGIGTLMTSDRKRVIYEGAWEKGRMHGHGAYYYYSEKGGEGGGSGGRKSPQECGKYVGQFRQSLRNGRGVYTLPDGSVYDGEFRDNIQNGYGVFHWPDGTIYEGPWRDGKRHGAHGILVASDGFRYEGSWVNNTMEGRGVATYPKGQVYDGTWVAGRREGRGTIRFTNGAVCEWTN
ncbi:hypothetical protein ACHAXA_006567 [Cyclostephanos tholiformis]|uniref:Uncharacterized protein n=1 Tax=Cyclostephanos tholiformis TaxID=382380 RepID=A0ABD3RRV2_9STRA